MNRFLRYGLILLLSLSGCLDKTSDPPIPVYPIPSTRQLAWQELEYYAFIHFNMNTFTDKEWGFGDEDPQIFNPTVLDCRQWARICKEAGMKGIILTAKHHDGFCLWPSGFTEHSVKNSPWKNGKGDVILELAEACKEYGLKMGIYYSPWDRNHPDYGKPEYLTYMRSQLRELLTNYGDLFEIWFDGANGGTGYYGGANEDRRVDKLTYYDWENTWAMVRELQPGAVIFSDAGPDVRWVGNEKGHAYPTTWSNLMRDSVYPGMIGYAEKYAPGQENGTHWVPAETDVSIRPGWYYHKSEDEKVKPLSHLLDIYYESIGMNSSLLLNIPVDTRGLIHENDVIRLKELAKRIENDFTMDLAMGCTVSATDTRGSNFKAENTIDDNDATYWSVPDNITLASLKLDFDQPTALNRILIQEYIPLGQRIKAFSVEVLIDDEWKQVVLETTVGYKRILRIPETIAMAVRINILDAKDCPTINNLSIYLASE